MTAAPRETKPSEVETEMVVTEDGRQLGVCQWGDLDGAPVFMLHGSPGSRLLRQPVDDYVENRLRVVTYDRPGYGVSTRMPGHLVADAASDVRRIADHLGLDRFGVAGVSAGGPRAVAVAALLPDRVTRCATIVSVGPFTAVDLDFYAGMDEDAQLEWQAARDGGAAMDRSCAEALEWVRTGLPGLDLGEDVDTMLRQAFTEAFRQGVDGFRDDREALARDWGFSVSDVKVPTRIMIGVDDVTVPRTHGEWLASHVHDALLIPVPGDHFGPRAEPEKQLMAWVGAPS